MFKKLASAVATVSAVAFAIVLLSGDFGNVTGKKVLAWGGQSNQQCPVASPYPWSFEERFGEGVIDAMQCVQRRHQVKVVMQLNNFCRDIFKSDNTPIKKVTDCAPGRAYALGNIKNMIKDYEITNGMKVGLDYEIAVVVHSGGGHLMRKGNPYEAEVIDLMEKGVNFYFCLNTVNKFISKGILTEGDVMDDLIDGVQFVSAGVTAIADFQRRGFMYVQP